jgi:hypothetical protein
MLPDALQVKIFSPINNTHATLTDFFNELIVRNCSTYHKTQRLILRWDSAKGYIIFKLNTVWSDCKKFLRIVAQYDG